VRCEECQELEDFCVCEFCDVCGYLTRQCSCGEPALMGVDLALPADQPLGKIFPEHPAREDKGVEI